MTLSLLAIFMIPFCLALVLAPKRMHSIVKDWAGSPGQQFLSSMILVFFSMLIVLSNGFELRFWEVGEMRGDFLWNFNTQVLLSWISLLMFAKSVCQLFPKAVAFKARLATEARLPIFGFVGLLFFLGMIYLETQVF